jgi:hypothetical protein
MSPRSQARFFESLHKIYQDQEQVQDLEASPEYTIVTAIDDSCVLFALKDNTPREVTANQSPQSNYFEDAAILDAPELRQ